MKGGKREGSGRKRLDSKKRQVSFRLAVDVLEYLDSQDRPKTEVIEEALREHKKNN